MCFPKKDRPAIIRYDQPVPKQSVHGLTIDHYIVYDFINVGRPLGKNIAIINDELFTDQPMDDELHQHLGMLRRATTAPLSFHGYTLEFCVKLAEHTNKRFNRQVHTALSYIMKLRGFPCVRYEERDWTGQGELYSDFELLARQA